MSSAEEDDDLWDIGLFSAFEGEDDEAPQTCGRFVLIEQIARGGIGTIHRARDERLERDVAVKRLRDAHVEDAAMVARFLTEARVAARLQHPGIVPIYDTGLDTSNRPYLCMKLVDGRTLVEVMKTESRDLDRLLDIFRHICGTMAFAHARGVIHRDLKPSNVMIGEFGEVLVVDWGFAKVLGDIVENTPERERVLEERHGGDSSSIAGSVLGTPAYMPPEQARGEIDALDERVDVFALGAMLCEILTGAPPYDRDSTQKALESAAGADLGDALTRLEAFDGDAKLAALCRSCLAEHAGDRPRDAGVLHHKMEAWFAATLKDRETARIEAASSAVQAREERKLRRVTIILATAVVALIIVGAALTWREASLRREANVSFRDAMDDFQERLGNEDWLGAERAIDVAILHARRGRNRDGAARIRAARRELDRSRDAAAVAARVRETAEAFQVALADITARGIDSPFDRDRELTLAFDAVGIRVDRVDASASAKRIRELGVEIEPMVALLDTWAAIREITRRRPGGRSPHTPSSRSLVLAEIASALDPDPERKHLRTEARAAPIEGLHDLVTQIEVGEARPQTLVMLALTVTSRGEIGLARALLEDAHHAHPGSFWINHHLSMMLATRIDPDRPVETADLTRALHHAWLSLAAAPESLLAREQVARAMLRLDDAAGAHRLLNESERLDADRATGLRRRLMRTGPPGAVLELCRLRLEDRPDDVITRAERATRLAQVAAFAEACAEARLCLDGSAAPRRAVRALLTSLVETGRYEEALDAARRFEIPKADPLRQEARRSLQFEERDEVPRGPRDLQLRGFWLARAGRVRDAAEIFAGLVEKGRRRPERRPRQQDGPGGPSRPRMVEAHTDRQRTIAATLLAAAAKAEEPTATRYCSLAVECFLRDISSSDPAESRRSLWRLDRRLEGVERLLASHPDLAAAWEDGMRRIAAD